VKCRHFVMPLAATLLLGCPSAYDQTFNQELGRLNQQERSRQERADRARAEARQYHAVVYFSVGSSMISEDGYRELQWFVDKIRPFPEAYVDVKGYADATGGEQINQNLSLERANNVASFLVQQGIPPEQMAPAGFSSNFPDEPNETAKGRSRNRRAEVGVR